MTKANEKMVSLWLHRGKEILNSRCKNLKIENLSKPFFDEKGMLNQNHFTALTFDGPNGSRQYINVEFL